MKLIVISSAALILLNQVSATPIAGCLLNYTVTANDSCVSVAAQFQLNETDFYAMNPGLHHSEAHPCDNLDSGKPYCVCVTAPCPVSLASNSSVSTAIVSGSSSVASVAASSAAPSSSATQSSSASASASKSSAVAASASVSSTSSASTTKIFGAVAAGLLIAATSALI